MIPLLNVFVNICRFQAGPQDIPYSRFLLILTIFLYLLMGLATSPMEQTAPIIISSLLDTTMLIGFAFAGLWIRGLINRGIQCVTALAGTGVLFGALIIVLSFFIPNLREAEDINLSSIIILALFFAWYIAVMGHILKNSLDVPFWAGIGIAILYVYTSLRVTSVIYVAHS